MIRPFLIIAIAAMEALLEAGITRFMDLTTNNAYYDVLDSLKRITKDLGYNYEDY